MNRIEIHITSNENKIGCTAVTEKIKRVFEEIGFDVELVQSIDVPKGGFFTKQREEIEGSGVNEALEAVKNRCNTKIFVFDDGRNGMNKIDGTNFMQDYGQKIKRRKF